jgi:hypothetical protein
VVSRTFPGSIVPLRMSGISSFERKICSTSPLGRAPPTLGATAAGGDDPGALASRSRTPSPNRQVKELLGHLEPRERSVIELRFGLGPHDPTSRAQTARRLALRRDDVRRFEDLALRKLRARPRS